MISKRQQVKNEALLRDLADAPGNNRCADCGSRNTGWASWNLGIFLCIRCAGIHRKMGTHISKIKSLSVDSWSMEQIFVMRDMGNTKSNAIWDPDNVRKRIIASFDEDEDSAIERYIRDKYELGKFRRDYSSFKKDDISDSSLADSETKIPDMSTSKSRRFRWGRKEKATDFDYNDDDTESGSRRPSLRERFSSSGKTSKNRLAADYDDNYDLEDKIYRLHDMGFKDRKKNMEALTRSNGDLLTAIEFLTGKDDFESRPALPPRPGASGDSSHNGSQTVSNQNTGQPIQTIPMASGAQLIAPPQQEAQLFNMNVPNQLQQPNLFSGVYPQPTGAVPQYQYPAQTGAPFSGYPQPPMQNFQSQQQLTQQRQQTSGSTGNFPYHNVPQQTGQYQQPPASGDLYSTGQSMSTVQPTALNDSFNALSLESKPQSVQNYQPPTTQSQQPFSQIQSGLLPQRTGYPSQQPNSQAPLSTGPNNQFSAQGNTSFQSTFPSSSQQSGAFLYSQPTGYNSQLRPQQSLPTMSHNSSGLPPQSIQPNLQANGSTQNGQIAASSSVSQQPFSNYRLGQQQQQPQSQPQQQQQQALSSYGIGQEQQSFGNYGLGQQQQPQQPQNQQQAIASQYSGSQYPQQPQYLMPAATGMPGQVPLQQSMMTGMVPKMDKNVIMSLYSHPDYYSSPVAMPVGGLSQPSGTTSTSATTNGHRANNTTISQQEDLALKPGSRNPFATKMQSQNGRVSPDAFGELSAWSR
ncbi:hypothetical protein V1511DRAFT_455030 [Dipodascopsis uninucleata]